mmetsp:Transcript_23306/g.63184  ORF Transcript_23306/g.63184 Transcript_23306/m.63184 type:complete len:308 (-) Transcript_23306:355-1278(-)
MAMLRATGASGMSSGRKRKAWSWSRVRVRGLISHMRRRAQPHRRRSWAGPAHDHGRLRAGGHGKRGARLPGEGRVNVVNVVVPGVAERDGQRHGAPEEEEVRTRVALTASGIGHQAGVVWRGEAVRHLHGTQEGGRGVCGREGGCGRVGPQGAPRGGRGGAVGDGCLPACVELCVLVLHSGDLLSGGLASSRSNPEEAAVPRGPRAPLHALDASDHQRGPGLVQRHARAARARGHLRHRCRCDASAGWVVASGLGSRVRVRGELCPEQGIAGTRRLLRLVLKEAVSVFPLRLEEGCENRVVMLDLGH